MPISGVSFTSAIGAMDKVSKEQLYSPGLYAIPELMQPAPRPYKEHMTFLGFLGRLVLTAAVVLGGPLLARKKINAFSKESIDVTQDLAKGAKIGERLKYHVAKFGEWVDKNMYQKLIKATAKDESTPKTDKTPTGNPAEADGAPAPGA